MYEVTSSGKFKRLSDAIDFYHELVEDEARGAGHHTVTLYEGHTPMASHEWDASEAASLSE